MKKTYTKPEVNEIAVEANQAVAACGVRRSGYDNSWTRGVAGQFGHSSTEAAWNAYDQHENYTYSENPADGLYVYPVYYGETVDANGQPAYGTFHDLNWNGIMDNGEYVAWQQGDYNTVAAALSAGYAAVNS